EIPATEGYSTLLIEYEIVAAQILGEGISPDDIRVSSADLAAATELFERLPAELAEEELLGEDEALGEGVTEVPPEVFIEEAAENIAVARTLNEATSDTAGEGFLIIAGVLLAIILLLAQGGGYVGGAAVASNAARLGRMPGFLLDDRVGIAVIWLVSAILIPLIREVVVVESYYAFGFVSAFVITSTTVFLVRDSALTECGIEPDSSEARSLRFAGLRGMIASYFMLVVLITQKTDALWAIAIAGAAITIFQIVIANGALRRAKGKVEIPAFPPGTRKPDYDRGVQRAHDQARQRGIAHAVEDLIDSGALAKFNVGPQRIRRMIAYLYNIDPPLFEIYGGHDHHEHIEEPSPELEETYQKAYALRDQIARRIEHYSHFGIFTFIHNYHLNWVAPEHGRDAATVQKAMLDILFPMTDHEEMWAEYQEFQPRYLPEPIWQFSRYRYLWAKDQWPNLSDRITTIWTLQDFGVLPDDVDVEMIISVAGGKRFRLVKIPTKPYGAERVTEELTPE
ncbi:MAG: hypothetical protein R3272_07475, partial [Candidatus Promineifilaceae bacterium]|nr:hypothetical protein [Candidatus Promineifilaceae bacterium]